MSEPENNDLQSEEKVLVQPPSLPETPAVEQAPGPVSVESFTLDDGSGTADASPPAEEATKSSERTKKTVYMDRDIYLGKDHDPSPYITQLPSDHETRITKIIEALPNVSLTDSTRGTVWAETIRNSLGAASMNEAFVDTLEDPDADFHNTVEVNGKYLGGVVSAFRERTNSKFDGEMAVLRTAEYLGLGNTWATPLWNSGIWVVFKPPGEDDLVELHRALTSDNINAGRETYGLAYSNISPYTVSRLCEFALRHIYVVSAAPGAIGAANLLDHVKTQDISQLLWGLACTMHPKGFSFSRACTANPEKCQHVVTDTLNVRKMSVVNRRGLSEKQKAHMARHRGTKDMTVQNVIDYQSEFTKAAGTRVEVVSDNKKIAFNLRSPSISEYIRIGTAWIDAMANMVDAALGKEATDKQRNDLMDSHVKAAVMRQYSHWVESIEMDSNTIEDRASVERTLAFITTNSEIRTKFTKAVLDYINASSVSVVGIPVYDCPACGEHNDGPSDKPFHTSMIPLDVLQLFFDLLTRKILAINAR